MNHKNNNSGRWEFTVYSINGKPKKSYCYMIIWDGTTIATSYGVKHFDSYDECVEFVKWLMAKWSLFIVTK